MTPALRCLLAAAWTFVFMAKVSGGVLLSEIVAANKTGLTDENGAHVDWIELYNDGPESVDLHHWHLTDDPLRPLRWEFPAVEIPAGGYLVVFASGKDRSDPGSPLHTDFSLAAEGEYLALTDAGGNAVDEIVHGFPPQVSDVSWGRVPGQPSGFAYFYSPTPGGINKLSARASDPPVISEGGHTFTTPFTVNLTSPQQGAQIYYTLNGSQPTVSSSLYSSPLTISATTRLRAVAVVMGQAVSLTRGAVYVQLAPDAVPVESNLPLMIIDNFGADRPDDGTNAAWMIFEPGGTPLRATLTSAPAMATPAFIKVRGSSTENANKYSLAVEARNEAGGDRDFLLLGLPADSDWILTAPYEYDRALIRNPLMYALSRQAGRYAPRTRQVELYLNTNGGPVTAADYFGVYTLTEKIKRSAARVNLAEISSLDNAGPRVTGGYIVKIDRPDPGESGFTGGGQALYYVDPDEPKVTSAQEAWLTSYLNSFRSSFQSSNFFDPVNGYAKWIDPATFVDHHILNVSAKNVDAFRFSAYFYKDRLSRFCAGPLWDFDRSMDSMDPRDDNFNTWRGESTSSDMGSDFFGYPWYADLFRDENFWQRWIDRFGELRRGVLSDANVQALVNAQAAEITDAAGRNFARWTDKPPRPGGWTGEVDHLRSWLTSRLNWMDSQFTRPPVANTAGGPVTAGFPLDLTLPSSAKPGTVIYYTTDGTDPRLFDVTTGQLIDSETFITLTSPVKVRLPVADPGTSWRNGSDFDDSAWWSGVQGVGYDDTTDYDPFIGFNLESPPAERRMKGVIQSCHLRYHFPATAAQISSLTYLKLRARCDDGMVVFLNGTKLPASINEPVTLAWNSGASSSTPDTAAMQFVEFIIQNPQTMLRDGDNVLAVQGLNATLNSTDFLIQLELLGGFVPANGPEVSPQAQVWDGPLTISSTTNIVARAYDPAGPFTPYPNAGAGSGKVPVGSHWSAPLRLTLLNGTVPASAANLTITEMMYHPGPLTAAEMAAGYTDRSEFEYIVLQNTSSLPVDLTGIHFTGGIVFTMPLGPLCVLQPGARGILVRNRAAFAMRSAQGLDILGEYHDKLSNAGELLTLLAANGDVIFSMQWDDGASWPKGADGAGYSMVHIPGAGLSSPSGWRRSIDINGEPQSPEPLSFATWQAFYFPDGGPESDSLADPDRDGMSNAAEYAAAMNPLSPFESGEPVVRTVSVNGVPCVQFKLRQRPGTAPWVIESSTDLVSWSPVISDPVVTSCPDGRDSIVWCFPQTAARASYRAKADASATHRLRSPTPAGKDALRRR
jgi:hypothetical protein